jgi:myo-inositol-1(or 4)-monophosphatase
MFRARVAQTFPTHGVLAEEMAESRASGHGPVYRWLFDPVDGTANFGAGLPLFCASLALEVDGLVEVAAVYEPSRGELFAAERRHGARLNGERIRVSRVERIGDAMLGCGFPHNARARVPAYEALIGEAAVRARGVRRLGSAALDLCYVACGRLDGFWDRHLKPWDTAAGALIVREAGGSVTSWSGAAFDCYSGEVLASNGAIHTAIVGFTRAAGGAIA